MEKRILAVENLIYLIRGQRIMLDQQFAELYGVPTGQLNRAVSRNIERFPKDFMFELTREEYRSLRCQIGILEKGHHSKYLPRVFTEQGVAMLSGVLRSPRAVQVNVAIMRAFVKLREALSLHKDLADKLKELESRVIGHDERIAEVFDAIRKLMAGPEDPPREIGFKAGETRPGP